jgi:predicted metal-dependent peptidase
MTETEIRKGTVEDELSRCINKLIFKEPFYAHILSGTLRKISDEIPTAAVGLHNNLIVLMVNPEFFMKELDSVAKRTAVIKHEVLHLVFRHLFRERKNVDAELWNIAADLVVNQYIGNWELPETAVTLKTFPDLDLKPEQQLEYYYEILNRLHKSNHSDGEGNSGNTKDKKHQKSAGILSQIYGASRHGDHSKWVIKNGQQVLTADGKLVNENVISGLEQSLSKQILDAAERMRAQDYGSLPGQVQQAINRIRESMNTKVDWKRMLRIFSSANGRTEIYHTMKRISRRFGTRPGIRIRQFKKLAVAIDTSGSIDRETLAQFFSEIDAIHRCGADVVIIECDHMVQNEYPYKRNQELKVRGGGGTSFDPVFIHINKNPRLRIDACIYLTDGYAPKPTVKPRCSLLYVITPDGSMGDHLAFGKTVLMKK